MDHAAMAVERSLHAVLDFVGVGFQELADFWAKLQWVSEERGFYEALGVGWL
jgi:hypothetical protein